MKKVLVLGSAGSIGEYTLKYLLSEGKYEITAVDLKNKKTVNKLKKYRNRINIVYGDILDKVLMESLVKDHDVIINLATVLPPFSELNKKITELVDYKGTKELVDTISKVNPNCYLIYASSTSLYDKNPASVKDKIDENNLSNYSLCKYKAEEIIKEKLKHYTILRIPLVLNKIEKESFIYTINKNDYVEVTTSMEAGYAVVRCIQYEKELNKKIFNVGMGEEEKKLFNDILKNILKYYGLSFKYILSRLFLEKSYKSNVTSDSDELDNIIHYRFDSTYNYYRRLERIGKKRKIRRLLAKPIIHFKNKR